MTKDEEQRSRGRRLLRHILKYKETRLARNSHFIPPAQFFETKGIITLVHDNKFDLYCWTVKITPEFYKCRDKIV